MGPGESSARAMPAPPGQPARGRGHQPPVGTPAHGVPAYGTPAHGVPRASGPPGQAQGGPGTPPQGTPHVGGPVTPAHGSPVYGGPTPPGGVPMAASARGGHPQQPETGGGYPGPRAGYGRGQRQAPGAPGQRRGPGGPRQDYLDAFEDDVFAAGAPGAVRAEGVGPSPANPAMPGQRQRVPGQRPHPGAAREDQRGSGAPGAQGEDIRTGESVRSAQGPVGGPPEPPDDEPLAPLAPIPPPPAEKSGRGRTFTGVAAAAVTTVLAFIIAGQVSGSEHGSADGAQGLKTGERASGADAASDPDGGPAARPTAPDKATRGEKPLSYDEKMAKSYPLADDFEGSGEFATVSGHGKGPGGGVTVRYRVDVEKDLPVEGELFARAVHKTLNDKRSWAHNGERSFERVSSGKADFVITLASPGTTDVWCAKSGLDTSQEKVSCDSAATDRIMINAYRWARGAETFGAGRMHSYRQMLINHEVGHRLGKGHVGCAADGELAPVMMQQTKYLTTDGATCRPNAWPFPRA